MIDEAAERGADLTKHLLAFARLQPLQPREIDVNGLVVTAEQIAAADARRAHRDRDGAGARIRGSPSSIPSQLTTAILNLVLNARDAMPQGGKLIIETHNSSLDEGYAGQHSEVKPGQYVLIAISDTGSGIPADLLDKVFEPFFTTKELGKGTGLGLSMVYGFVKQSGGHIKIYSEEGHGTTIKLYLPRSTEASQGADRGQGRGSRRGRHRAGPGGRGRRAGPQLCVAQVQSLGYRTLSAANADEALHAICCEPDDRFAVHRRHHAGPDERPAARRPGRKDTAAA